MNREARGISTAIVGSAIAFAAYYVVFGFPAIARPIRDDQKPKIGAKTSTQALAVAREACSYAPEDSVVLAPRNVSRRLLLLPDCPAPLFVDMELLNIPVSEKIERHSMVRHVEVVGDISFSERRAFLDDLRRYRIRVVVMSSEGIRNPRVKQILRQSSYEKVEMVEKYHVWIQRDSWQKVDERNRREARQLCQRVPKNSYVLVPYGIAAQLDKHDCCRSVLDHPPAALANAAFDKKRDLLENVLSVNGDPTPEEIAALDELLDYRLIRGIILVQKGDGNLRLKNELRRYNFKLAMRRDYYRLWVPTDGQNGGKRKQ